jgi:hypothetical protein
VPTSASSANSTTTSKAQRRSQRDQDGSEIRSVELERLTAEGMTLIERRNSMEYFRDQAAEHFARHTGSHWHPRSGSMVNHRALTSAVIDSRDFLAAKRRAKPRCYCLPGPKIAFTGGLDCNDVSLIWGQARSGPCQASRTWFSCTAVHRRAPSVSPPAGPTTAKFRKSPSNPIGPNTPRQHPFKRNDQMLDVLPIGVIAFPGTGIQENLADKARKLGIPVWKFGNGGA